MKTALNVKNMKEAYANAKKDMGEVWTTFNNMYNMGFITYTEWIKFVNTCGSWTYDEETDSVIDFYEETVVKSFA